MKRHRVMFHASAERDVRETVIWLQQHLPSQAAAWIECLESAIQSLSEVPLRCPEAAESRFFGEEIRQLLLRAGPGKQTYQILFTVQGRTAHVLHVRHGRRLPLQPD